MFKLAVALIVSVIVIYLFIINAEDIYIAVYRSINPAATLPSTEAYNMYCSIDKPFSCRVIDFNITTGTVVIELINEGEFSKGIHYAYCSRIAYDFTVESAPPSAVSINTMLSPKSTLTITMDCAGYDPRFFVEKGTLLTFTGHIFLWYAETLLPSDRRLVTGQITVQSK